MNVKRKETKRKLKSIESLAKFNDILLLENKGVKQNV